MSAQQRCVCGYAYQDTLETLACVECRALICLQCEYRHPQTCQSYCRACTQQFFGQA